MTKPINAQMLRDLNACGGQVELFVKLFKEDDVVLTEELCVQHAQDFDFNLAASNLLEASQKAAYEKAIAPHWKAYEKAVAPHWKAYEEAKAPLWEACEKAKAPFLKAYEEAKAPHWKTYEKAIALHWKAYEEAKAPLWKAYEEALAPHWKAYEEAKAAAFFASYEMEKEMNENMTIKDIRTEIDALVAEMLDKGVIKPDAELELHQDRVYV